ncbi:MAG: tRNA epoxyqueuosine(34) reductase QueG [Chitinophagaceae bacterium]
MNRKEIIKNIAASLGFDACGIAKATSLDEDARRLEKWLQNGYNGTMEYMEKHFDLRVDPRKLVPGAKSIITLLVNYFPSQTQKTNDTKIARYAYGKDYHLVIKNKLHAFLSQVESQIGKIEGRGFVDSAPVLERSWAVKSGLGWVGKNGNFIQKKGGSWFFIATLITDLELEADPEYHFNHCGSCTRCIDACPTEAILPDKIINGSKCISYFTIELKDMLIPEKMKGQFDGWMFGCDVCQEVCPWNRFEKPNQTKELEPIWEVIHFNKKDWLDLSEDAFQKIFRESPLKRSKFQGIQRNLKFLEIQDSSLEDQ